MALGTYSLTDRERMGLLSRNLKYRCVITKLEKTVQDADTPGYWQTNTPVEETYTALKTIWCYIIPKQTISDFISSVRGQSEGTEVTHEIIVRWESVRSLGAGYSSGFDSGFDTVQRMNPMKTDFYLFVKSGGEYRGRRFRIRETRWDERNHEYLRLRCEEIEEVGTGYTA